ncbi:hypothetical protein BDV18DRAFT_39673 [Aspergillus unguis]
MLPNSNGSHFVFVGGPSLNAQPGNARSTLLRRVLAEKRTKRREDAAKELDIMLNKGRGHMGQGCTCGNRAESSTTNRLLPENKPEALPGRCWSCGITRSSSLNLQTISGGRSDPLLPVDATATRLKVHELLDFTTTTLWPHFRSQDYAGNCYKSWVFPYEGNLLVYAVLWSASYHRDILRITYGSEPRLESREQLELKALALQALRKEISNLSITKSPDSVVMCILYLAVNDRQKTRIVRDPSPFNPPYTSLQALDFYGSRDYDPLHWTVVQQIVHHFGGIQCLKAFALAWLLSLSDLMGAVQTLSKPIYPILGVDGKPLDLLSPQLLFQPHGVTYSMQAGSGFHELFYIWPPVRPELVSVFIHLGQYSNVLQQLSEGPCSPEVLDLLGDSRNVIHHKLLSLPNENDSIETIIQCMDQNDADNELTREIYLTCRLSAILYAVHVTFPIPRTELLRQSIREALYPRFERLSAQSVSSALIVWCVAVAVSMSGEKAPRPLVSYMMRLLKDTGVTTLAGLVTLLKSFAWVASAVNSSWEALWTDFFRVYS